MLRGKPRGKPRSGEARHKGSVAHMAIRCNQMQSNAIRGTQRHSEAIRGNQRGSVAHMARAPTAVSSSVGRSGVHGADVECVHSAPRVRPDRTHRCSLPVEWAGGGLWKGREAGPGCKGGREGWLTILVSGHEAARVVAECETRRERRGGARLDRHCLRVVQATRAELQRPEQRSGRRRRRRLCRRRRGRRRRWRRRWRRVGCRPLGWWRVRAGAGGGRGRWRAAGGRPWRPERRAGGGGRAEWQVRAGVGAGGVWRAFARGGAAHLGARRGGGRIAHREGARLDGRLQAIRSNQTREGAIRSERERGLMGACQQSEAIRSERERGLMGACQGPSPGRGPKGPDGIRRSRKG